MSDISLEFTWFEWLTMAFIVGWPGLIIGGALGAAAFQKKGRIVAALIAALVGCFAWFAAVLFLK